MIMRQVFITTATSLILICSLAIASPPADDLLSGPTIDIEEVTANDMLSRKMSETGKKNKLNTRLQMRMWMSTMELMNLTSAQKKEIDALLKELHGKQRDFQKTYGKEISALREEHNEQKRDVFTTILVGAPKDQAAVSDASQKRMRELMELAPDVTVYQDKAWAFLNVDQQKDFQTKYQLKVDEEMKRRDERKRKDQPGMDDLNKRRGFNPEDSLLRDKTIDSEDDYIDRPRDSIDEESMRRIKFLRRLQQLQDG